MTMKDNAPTWIAVMKAGPVHLSEDGSTTLCGYVVRDGWKRHDERVALFTLWLSGASLCRRCEDAASVKHHEAAPAVATQEAQP